MGQDQPTNLRKTPLRATQSQRRKGVILFLLIFGGLGSVTMMEVVGFDMGRLFHPCGFKQQYQLPCPTCGFTRSIRAFACGRIGLAFYTQPGAAFLGLIMVFSALTGLFIAVTGIYPRWIHGTLSALTLKRIFWLLALIILLSWAVTLARAWRLNHV